MNRLWTWLGPKTCHASSQNPIYTQCMWKTSSCFAIKLNMNWNTNWVIFTPEYLLFDKLTYEWMASQNMLMGLLFRYETCYQNTKRGRRGTRDLPPFSCFSCQSSHRRISRRIPGVPNYGVYRIDVNENWLHRRFMSMFQFSKMISWIWCDIFNNCEAVALLVLLILGLKRFLLEQQNTIL